MAAATAAGVVGGNASSASWMQFKGKERKHAKMNRSRVYCSYSSSVMDPYKTLRIQRGASESEVRKAFRQLALQVSIPTLNFILSHWIWLVSGLPVLILIFNNPVVSGQLLFLILQELISLCCSVFGSVPSRCM